MRKTWASIFYKDRIQNRLRFLAYFKDLISNRSNLDRLRDSKPHYCHLKMIAVLLYRMMFRNFLAVDRRSLAANP